MYAADKEATSEFSAFKAIEKKLQLHKDQVFSQSRASRRRSKGFAVRPTDLSDVIDLQPGTPPPPGVTCLGAPPGLPPSAAAYSFEAHPGLLVVRGALPAQLQRRLVADALTWFNEPPNHTTHTRAHPQGLPGIWAAAQQGLRLQQGQQQQQGQGEAVQQQQQQQPEPAPQQDGQAQAAAEAASAPNGSTSAGSASSGRANSGSSGALWGPGGSGPTAQSLLRRLRWATLGPPYDWTARAYLRDVPHLPLPRELCQLALALAGLAEQLLGLEAGCGGSSSGSGGGSYSPDAALVNFYYEGDTLNGHVDDAERDLTQPLVSLSLGCEAAFLMGGATKQEAPTALLLRSGDAVVLAGPARRCCHGVPRIFTDRPLPEALRCGAGSSGGGCGGGSGESNCCEAGCSGGSGDGIPSDEFEPFARHMQACRINISIRDTR